MTKPNRMTPEAEQARISELYRTHNGDKRAMAEALNNEGVPTQKKKKWSVQAVTAAIKRNRYISPSVTKSTPITSQHEETTDPGAEEDSQGGITNELAEDYHPEQDASANERRDGEPDTTTNELPGGPQHLEPEVIELLNEAHGSGLLKEIFELASSGALTGMSEWWGKNRGIAMNTATRPVFKGTKKNTGINISEDILERARSKAESEKGLVGRSTSQLCEYLLWRYIGAPQDLVEGPETQDNEEVTN